MQVRSNGMQLAIRLHFCPECPSIHREQISVKTPATKQLNQIFTQQFTLNFSDYIETGFATQPPWNVMYKTRHALLGRPDTRERRKSSLHWSGVRRITHFVRVEVVMSIALQSPYMQIFTFGSMPVNPAVTWALRHVRLLSENKRSK